MGVVQTAAAIPVDSSPETTDSLIAYRNSAKGRKYNTLTLDGDKHYTLLFTECDQKFTPTEWGTALVSIAQVMGAQDKTFDVQALFEVEGDTLTDLPSGTNVFWEYWGDKPEFPVKRDVLTGGSYYCLLLCESDLALTQEDIEAAEGATAAAVPARTISMKKRQYATYTSDVAVQFTAHHQYEDSQRELTSQLNAGDRSMRIDMFVEVPIATLDNDAVGPDATVEGTTKTWREHRAFVESQDGSTALISLAPKVGSNSWNAHQITSDMLDAYITEFGAENILSFEAYKTLRNSEAYTDPDSEAV